MNICALIDVTGSKLTKIEKLVRDGDLEAQQLIRLGTIVEAEEADMEDLMSVDFYLRLVRGVGADDANRAIYSVVQEDRLPAKADEGRITKRIDDVLKGFGHNRLDHLPPALYFERHQDELLPLVDGQTIERAERLFAAANGQLRK